MSQLRIGSRDALYYEYSAPSGKDQCTFVFVNALTGDAGSWMGVIGPRLLAAGHGVLVYNLRGQTDSSFSPELRLDDHLIVSDLVRLMEEVEPERPILVGLSIGGLFAARAWLTGAHALGIVLSEKAGSNGTQTGLP